VSISVKQNNTYATATGVWVKVSGVWKQVASDGLTGLGGWATITAVSGTYTKHSYNDGVMDWVAYEWTDDGTITTSGGLVDALVVGGGSQGGGSGNGGGGGSATAGVIATAATEQVSVSTKNISSGNVADNRSIFGQLIAGPGVDNTIPSNVGGPFGGMQAGYNAGGGGGALGDGGSDGTPGRGLISSIRDGNPVEYGRGGAGKTFIVGEPDANTGGGGDGNNYEGADGVVIVRVPAANAQGVAETFHGWDSFALVTDGVVTEVTKVPDNEPHTLDAEWLPCPADVQAGWSHADGEFTPPPAPTRDDLIAELKAQIKDLQKDK